MKKSFCSCNVILFLLTTWFIFPAFSQTNFWEPTNGPYGGSISSLAMNTIGYAFAGTATYGVYRTGNVGAGWEHLNTGLAYEPSVYSLTVLSNDYIYVGTNFGIIR